MVKRSLVVFGPFQGKFGAVHYDYAEYRFERLPLKQADLAAREVVKKLIGFKDAR